MVGVIRSSLFAAAKVAWKCRGFAIESGDTRVPNSQVVTVQTGLIEERFLHNARYLAATDFQPIEQFDKLPLVDR
jgi:hypothetical protein